MAAGASTVTAGDQKPTHRLRVKFAGPPTGTVPITGDQQVAIARDLAARSNGKMVAVFNSNSPVLSATLPRGWKTGDPLVYWYEVDAWLAPGVNPQKAAQSVEALLAAETRFGAAGLRLLSAVFDAIGEVASKVVNALKPILIVGGIAVGSYIALKLVSLIPKRASLPPRVDREDAAAGG